jgi:PhnB protein
MTKAIPDGLRSVTPALTIDGCAEAIEFYKAAFAAVEEGRAPDPSGKKIWHAQLRIGDSAIFVNDAFPEQGALPNTTSLWLYSEDVDAAFQRAVAAGAQVKMALADMFWGDRLGSVLDRWGNRWTLAQRVKELAQEQLEHARDDAASSWQEGRK